MTPPERSAVKVESDKFESYYRAQEVVGEDEWDGFLASLRSPLPLTFRIIDGTVNTEWVRKFIRETVAELGSESGAEYQFAKLPWYSNHGEAYELKAGRQVLRKLPILSKLNRFLIEQSESGVIVRQEAVSMIPAMFILDQMTNDDFSVIDMCAAPGSKTTQLIEGLNRARSDEMKAAGIPARGVIVANDLNSTRAHMLVHRVKFQTSPNLMVTLHNASLFPRLWEGSSQFKFDAVLCDVPCSGDGTLRKAPQMWKKWTCMDALGLHKLQMKILKKGLALAKVGGTVVYSTCSLNPIENEAVVAAILRSGNGSVRLVRKEIDGLKAAPGMTTWKVPYRGNHLYSDLSEVPESLLRKKIYPSMFPPNEPSLQQELKDKCSRFLPHLNDTGGFFVAVLYKAEFTPWEEPKLTKATHEEPAPKDAEDDDDEEEDEVLLPRQGCDSPPKAAVEQVDFKCLADLPELKELISEYIEKPFQIPIHSSALSERLWTRLDPEKSATSAQLPHQVWIVSDAVRRLLRARTMKAPLRVLHAGTTFCESRSNAQTRLSSAGFSLARNIFSSLSPPCQPLVTRGAVRLCPMKLMEALVILEEGSNRLNYGQLEENDWRRLALEACEKEKHYMFVLEDKREGGASMSRALRLAWPVYVGNKNAEVLVSAPAREALRILIASLVTDAH